MNRILVSDALHTATGYRPPSTYVQITATRFYSVPIGFARGEKKIISTFELTIKFSLQR